MNGRLFLHTEEFNQIKHLVEWVKKNELVTDLVQLVSNKPSVLRANRTRPGLIQKQSLTLWSRSGEVLADALSITVCTGCCWRTAL